MPNGIYLPPLRINQFGAYAIGKPVWFKTRLGQPVTYQPQILAGRTIARYNIGAPGQPVVQKTVWPHPGTKSVQAPVRDVYGLSGFGDYDTLDTAELQRQLESDPAKTQQILNSAKETIKNYYLAEFTAKALLAMVTRAIQILMAPSDVSGTYFYGGRWPTGQEPTGWFSADAPTQEQWQKAIAMIGGQSNWEKLQTIMDEASRLRRELQNVRSQISQLPSDFLKVVDLFLGQLYPDDMYSSIRPGYGNGIVAVLIIGMIVTAVIAISAAVGINSYSRSIVAKAAVQETRARTSKELADQIQKESNPEIKKMLEANKNTYENAMAETESNLYGWFLKIFKEPLKVVAYGLGVYFILVLAGSENVMGTFRKHGRFIGDIIVGGARKAWKPAIGEFEKAITERKKKVEELKIIREEKEAVAGLAEQERALEEATEKAEKRITGEKKKERGGETRSLMEMYGK